MRQITICLLAGEASGDRLGSHLMQQLRVLASEYEVKFIGAGGDLMKQEGLHVFFPIEEINMMGFLEILPHIFRLRWLINKTTEDIIAAAPDIVITIDSPGFNFRVASNLRKRAPHLKLMHYVAPSVWAYKPGRAKKIAKIYDHLLCLLPFEPPYFEEHGLKSHFIGHAIFEQDLPGDRARLYQKYNLDKNKRIIAVTPGSRIGEIKKHIGVLIETMQNINQKVADLIFFIPAAHKWQREFLADELEGHVNNVLISSDHEDKIDGFTASMLAIAKSGTNTLEISACNTPLIVGYKLNWLTWILLKLMIKVKYASLVNIMAGKEIIPEFIQHHFNSQELTAAALDYIENKKLASRQVREAQMQLKKMGFGSKEKPSLQAAKVVMEIIEGL